MEHAYIIENDGSTEPLERVRCNNEVQELQRILEKNYNLLAGEQINPEDPRRWMLIAREMLVPDPSTGIDRWSVDFFFVDQDARPTFVECKRFDDTRSRREIIGQLLEYAANGHYYWNKDDIQSLANKSAHKRGTSIEEELDNLQINEEIVNEDFFEQVENNLRIGQIRLIFFLDKAPLELKSVVDFLNKQMERTEVLLVEARQYIRNNLKIVIPILFGYTEQARKIKKSITITGGERKHWDYSSFFSDAHSRLSKDSFSAIKRIYNECNKLSASISWGSGKTAGSFKVSWPHIISKTIFCVYSNGRIEFSFNSLKDNEISSFIRDRLKEYLVKRLSLHIPENYENKHPSYPIEQWQDKVSEFCEILNFIVQEFEGSATQSDPK